MADLNMQSLEKLCVDLAKYVQDTGEAIAIKPTKLVLVKYPGEAMQEWQERCQRARESVALLSTNMCCEKARGTGQTICPECAQIERDYHPQQKGG